MLIKKFKPKCLATAIGSIPFAESISAYKLVLEYLPEIPVTPEFPSMGYKHTFCGPFLENLPGLVALDKREIFYFDTSADNSGEFEKFYENYLSGNSDYFKISCERGIGFYNLLKFITNNPPSNMQYYKTQMPGPITTGLIINDETGKNIIYNEEFMQIIIKAIIMKAKWQINEIKKIFPEIIFFFDEPGLVNYGSSYFNIEKNYIIQSLNEVFEAVHVITGSHCCGNTDWSILMETKVDIISFDAFTYSGAMAMYPDHLKKFLLRNGNLAWGIIPNSQEIYNHTPDALVKKFEDEINILVQKGFSKKDILSASLITPSCGLGNLAQDIAEKVLWTLQKVSMVLRAKYSLNDYSG